MLSLVGYVEGGAALPGGGGGGLVLITKIHAGEKFPQTAGNSIIPDYYSLNASTEWKEKLQFFGPVQVFNVGFWIFSPGIHSLRHLIW